MKCVQHILRILHKFTIYFICKLYKRKTTSYTDVVLLREVTAGFEPAMTVLQTGALPLGYVTIYYTKKLPE